jgi:hypothetical protein
MSEVDPSAILAQLEQIRAGTLERFEPLTQEQLDWRPPVVPGQEGEAGWSLGEIFMHIALDEPYVREYIARPLLEGVQPPEELFFIPPPPPRVTPKAIIRHRLERERAQTRTLLEHWPAGANLTLTHAGGLDPMNGAEWLQGYGGHEAFHHRQIDTLLAQLIPVNA